MIFSSNTTNASYTFINSGIINNISMTDNSSNILLTMSPFLNSSLVLQNYTRISMRIMDPTKSANLSSQVTSPSSLIPPPV